MQRWEKTAAKVTWNQTPALQEKEPFLLPGPLLPAFLAVALLCPPWCTFTVGLTSWWLASEVRMSLFIFQALLPFVGNGWCFSWLGISSVAVPLRLPAYRCFGLFLLLLLFLKISMTVNKEISVYKLNLSRGWSWDPRNSSLFSPWNLAFGK